MLKSFVLGTLLVVSSQVVFASTAVDSLNLAGQWVCSGYDSHDGGYKDAILTLTLDEKNSDFEHNFGAYHFKLSEPEATYLGEAAASGNMVAIYFANQAKESVTDQGVGIAAITHDRNEKGEVNTVLHKFYYEPTYEHGGNGSETCIKQVVTLKNKTEKK